MKNNDNDETKSIKDKVRKEKRRMQQKERRTKKSKTCNDDNDKNDEAKPINKDDVRKEKRRIQQHERRNKKSKTNDDNKMKRNAKEKKQRAEDHPSAVARRINVNHREQQQRAEDLPSAVARRINENHRDQQQRAEDLPSAVARRINVNHREQQQRAEDHPSAIERRTADNLRNQSIRNQFNVGQFLFHKPTLEEFLSMQSESAYKIDGDRAYAQSRKFIETAVLQSYHINGADRFVKLYQNEFNEMEETDRKDLIKEAEQEHLSVEEEHYLLDQFHTAQGRHYNIITGDNTTDGSESDQHNCCREQKLLSCATCGIRDSSLEYFDFTSGQLPTSFNVPESLVEEEREKKVSLFIYDKDYLL